jgi:hypothetical protein
MVSCAGVLKAIVFVVSAGGEMLYQERTNKYVGSYARAQRSSVRVCLLIRNMRVISQ